MSAGNMIRLLSLAVVAGAFAAPPVVAQSDTNACPVDGCQVRIVSVEKEGDELRVTLDANITTDMSRNHLHIWWGDNFTIQQVSDDAESVHGVQQGDWHPTDIYPVYVTQSGASTSVRGEATTLCVSASDRNHDIIDIAILDCRSVADLLQ